MHKQLRGLLDKAIGISEHVIALVIDIRGFTTFCQTVDSMDTAIYIKKIYMKLIDDYFSNASYYKPTGDGLLVIIPYNEESLKEVLNQTIMVCLRLLVDFPHLCNHDAMINFPTPDKIGIGIARGSACCITSDEKILDYSGKVLNLASRLMELSRPSGITFDESLGYDLLSDETKKSFIKDSVFVRSVAEEKPLTIFYTKDYTLLSSIHKLPIKEPRWEIEEHKATFEDVKRLGPQLSLYLKAKQLTKKKIICELHFPTIADGKVLEGYTRVQTYTIPSKKVSYSEAGKEYKVSFKLAPIIKDLKKYGLADNMTILFRVKYPRI